jgi:hypothetical protein
LQAEAGIKHHARKKPGKQPGDTGGRARPSNRAAKRGGGGRTRPAAGPGPKGERRCPVRPLARLGSVVGPYYMTGGLGPPSGSAVAAPGDAAGPPPVDAAKAVTFRSDFRNGYRKSDLNVTASQEFRKTQ